MNAIAVLNLKDYMPKAVRESFLDACDRWGCAFVEITKPFGRMHHFWQKSLIPLSDWTKDYDRVLQLDCDMLIRSDCPSIFDMVPQGDFGAVSRIQPRSRRAGIANWERIQATRMGLEVYPEAKYHLNCGLLLYSPVVHRKLLQAWQDTGRRLHWRRFRIPEQFTLSCLVQTLKTPTTWLPWQYNTTAAGRVGYAPLGPMQTYVYHFCGPKVGGLESIVNRCQWKL